MYLPSSTYRIQANSSFKFSDLDRILDYLNKLGISTIYSAPFFQSRKESVHGYDVTNPHTINSEIGTEEELQEIVQKLKQYKMTWLQDIVPNHMAFDSSNPWLMDIFEKGHHSLYYNFFDIDWNYQDDVYVLEEHKGLKGKVMAPFLGGEAEELMEKGDIKIQFDSRGFFVKYYSLEFPLSWPSYCDILSYGKKFYEIKKEESREPYSEYLKFLKEVNLIKDEFPHSFDAEAATGFKELIYQQYTSETELKSIIDHCLYTINSNPTTIQSILDQQYFKLVHWRSSEKKINYRRFFTINDLICLRIEDEKVFEHYHQYIQSLIRKGWVQGLRIDHIDGLKDPAGYVERLRKAVGEEIYVVVEKILESEEEMPDSWPIQGTSGYEFLSLVNRLLTEDKNKERFSAIYQDFIDQNIEYENMVFDKKMFILKEKMAGELNNLLKQILEITHQPLSSNVKKALAVFMASFPVYRVYPTEIPLNEIDSKILNTALEQAQKRAPELNESLSFLKDVFTTEHEKGLDFVKRSQQFTGPLAAKGVEDTVFYIYNRLISHNEVGDSPHLFGTTIPDFHRRMQERFTKTPYSINATATHDTKRGEDARMRINVLSEIPDQWTSAVFSFKEINKKYKKETEGKRFPSDNDEYFIYQALIGGLPMDGIPDEDFKTRFKEYLIKVVREAKVNTDWSEQNEVYENSVTDFIENILNDQDFLNALTPVFELVKNYGIIYSLAQTILKTTSPGIPDTYQGTELWDLSFVDPDNRRPVDFAQRQHYLSEVEGNLNNNNYIDQLISSKDDGRIKLYTLYNALQERTKNFNLFTKGEYIPLNVSEDKVDNVIAFARRWHDQWALVVVPKSIVELSDTEQFGIGQEVWGDTTVSLPANAPEVWSNVFTKKLVELQQIERPIGVSEMVTTDAFMEPFMGENSVTENQLSVSEILQNFPVGLLIAIAD